VRPTRDELLDHDADGIREFDNAMPRWWLYTFYVTIVFAAIYMVNYHLLPQPIVGRAGMAAEYQAEMAAAAGAGGGPAAATATLAALTDAASLSKGRAIFESQTSLCSSCHRPDLGGLVGPNLTDAVWLHGCTPGELAHSVATGFPPRGMLPFGGGPKLTDEQLLQLVSYVLSKRGSNPANPKSPDPARDSACG
jgi:cytochrome c oxidase cbb3-type subunit III